MSKPYVHPFNEAGRRVKAAVDSYLLRRAGVDRTLKEMPDVVDESWAELAERLVRGTSEDIAKRLMGGSTPESGGSTPESVH